MGMNQYAWIDRTEGLQPIFDEDGKAVTLEPKSCRARKTNLRCMLDAVHKALNISHVHRHEDGRLEAFRTE